MPLAFALDGIPIHFEVTEGQGSDPSTVVLLQGLGLSSRFWFEQPELLRDDANGPRRIVVIDNRGTGKSGRPRGLCTMKTMADDVVAVLDAIDCASAIVVGISMGGMIAQLVAIHHPTRVAGLVLLATMPGFPHARLPSPRVIFDLLSLPVRSKGKPDLQQTLLLPEKDRHRAGELMAEWPAAFLADPVSKRTFAAQLFAIVTNWTGKAHARIRCPTVVVSGEDDVLVPPVNGARLAARIRHARHEMMPDVAHGIPLLDRDVVRRSLRTLAAMSPA